MATKIIPKKSTVAAKVPLDTDLEIGEIAINLTDRKLYSKNASGEVVEIGGAGAGFDQDLNTTDDVTFNSVSTATLQITGGTGNQGTITWNADEETIDVITNGSVTQVGQELVWNVKNQTGSTIPNGTPVMATGTVGTSGRITVAPMDGTNAANVKYFLGVTTEEILDGADGKVTHFGKVRDIDTSAYSEGTVLYISTTTAGAFQTTEPTSGLNLPIAFVITSHANNGVLAVRVKNIDINAFQPYDADTVIDGSYVHTDNNYTTTEKNKLAGIEAGADVTDANNVNPLIDTHLNTSTALTSQILAWDGADYNWVAAGVQQNDDVTFGTVEANAPSGAPSVKGYIGLKATTSTQTINSMTLSTTGMGDASGGTLSNGDWVLLITSWNFWGSDGGLELAVALNGTVQSATTLINTGIGDTFPTIFKVKKFQVSGTPTSIEFGLNNSGTLGAPATGTNSSYESGMGLMIVFADEPSLANVTNTSLGNGATMTGQTLSSTTGAWTFSALGGFSSSGSSYTNPTATNVYNDTVATSIAGRFDVAFGYEESITTQDITGSGSLVGLVRTTFTWTQAGSGSGAALTANGDISVTGTVDGRDIAADGTKLDGIEAGATADQTITAGPGLTGGGTGDVTLSHADTSSQVSVNNSDGTVIQDVTLDTYGHVTGLVSYNLDSRYYTESEADSRFVNITGDTMTGNLTMNGAIVKSNLNTVNATTTATTVDFTASNFHVINMSSNTTFTFSNLSSAISSSGTLVIKQDATGGRSFTLPSVAKTPVGGASIVQSTGANTTSILSYLVVSSTEVLVNYVGDFA